MTRLSAKAQMNNNEVVGMYGIVDHGTEEDCNSPFGGGIFSITELSEGIVGRCATVVARLRL